MSESVVIEVYENHCKGFQGWKIDTTNPWTLKTLERCNPPDDFRLPSGEWTWASNWRIDKKPGVTDEDGWEYASRYSRFKSTDRRPKPVCLWGDSARRRKWSRIMRREAGIGKSADLNRVMPKIRVGLQSIQAARGRIEDIMKEAPEAGESAQMQQLVQSVNKNIADIVSALDQVDKQQGGPSAQTKKLRNDVKKEEDAIERALAKGPSKSKPITLRKVNGGGGYTPTTRSSLSAIPDRDMNGDWKMGGSSGGGGGGRFVPTTRSSMTAIPDRDHDGAWELSSSAPTDRYSIGPATDRHSFSGGSFSNGQNGHVTGAPTSSAKDARDSKKSSAQQPKQEVKSGTAGAFNPAIMSNKTSSMDPSLFGSGEEDGIFMDRSMHDLLIEQKLKPVDEATVMQELIDERSVEIQKVHKGIVEINEMFADLSKIVKAQQVEIDSIFNNVEESHAKTKEAFQHIVAANRLQKEGGCIVS